MIRRFLAFSVSLCVIISLCSFSVSATDTASVDDSSIEIHLYYSDSTSSDVPSSWTEFGWRDVEGLVSSYHTWYRITGIRIRNPHAVSGTFLGIHFRISRIVSDINDRTKSFTIHGTGDKEFSNSINSVNRKCFISDSGCSLQADPSATFYPCFEDFDFYLTADFTGNYLNTEFLTYNFSDPMYWHTGTGGNVISSKLFCQNVTVSRDTTLFVRSLFTDLTNSILNLDDDIRDYINDFSDNLDPYLVAFSQNQSDIVSGLSYVQSKLNNIYQNLSDTQTYVSLIKNSFDTLLSNVQSIITAIDDIDTHIISLDNLVSSWSPAFVSFLSQFAVLWRTAWGFARIRALSDGTYQIETGTSSFFNSILIGVNSIATMYQAHAQLENQAKEAGANDALDSAYDNAGSSFGSLGDFAGVTGALDYYNPGAVSNVGSSSIFAWFSSDNYIAINGTSPERDGINDTYGQNASELHNLLGGEEE